MLGGTFQAGPPSLCDNLNVNKITVGNRDGVPMQGDLVVQGTAVNTYARVQGTIVSRESSGDYSNIQGGRIASQRGNRSSEMSGSLVKSSIASETSEINGAAIVVVRGSDWTGISPAYVAVQGNGGRVGALHGESILLKWNESQQFYVC